MVGPSSLLAQRAASEGPRLGRGRVSARPGRVGEKVRAVEDNPTIPSGISKSFFYGKEKESEEGRVVKGFRSWFMHYGLVAAVLVSTALVAVLAFRLDGSRWRWPMVALALAGIGTAVGILWIKRYINSLTKKSEEEGR